MHPKKLVPIYGFMKGDTLGILVLAQSDEKVASVISKIQRSADVRVKARGEYRLLKGSKELDLNSTVQECGLEALDRVDLVPYELV